MLHEKDVLFYMPSGNTTTDRHGAGETGEGSGLREEGFELNKMHVLLEISQLQYHHGL